MGDAVIACGGDGSVVFMNGVAETLTGWSQGDAKGRPIHDVFHIINESTREPVESPVDKVRRLGTVVGLANHTLLVRRDGSEVAIDDSGAPIFAQQADGSNGELTGIVLIFREITERRRAERNLEMLSASGAVLADTLDVPTTLKKVAELCCQAFCDFCLFDLIAPDGTLQATTQRHRDPAMQTLLERGSKVRPSAQNSDHPVVRAMRSGKPVLVDAVNDAWTNNVALTDDHAAMIKALQFHSLLAIPLRSGSEELGALTFCRAANPVPLNNDDAAVAEELGRRISTAIMNGRLYRTLAAREESLLLALQAGKIGIWEFHPLSGRLVWSPRVREIFGVGQEETIDIERNFALIHPDDREATTHAMQRTLDPAGDGAYEAEFRAVRPSGEIRWVSAKGRAFFEKKTVSADSTAERVATRFVGMVLDVTDARHADTTIRASEARFRTLIENASIGILIGDLQGGLSYINPALLKLLRYSQQDVTEGRVRWDRLTPPEFAELDRKAVRELIECGTCEPYEKAYLDASGRKIPLLLGAMMIAASGTGEAAAKTEVAVFVTDLTGLRQTESALRESEKLAAVGRLAGSIAHEINNPLEAVTNLLYLLHHDVQEPALKQLVATAQEELGRVSHIVTHTLRFHRQATKPTLTKISVLLESVLALYRGRIANGDIQVAMRLRGSQPLLCYEGEIRQVLANLIGNAIDASSRGGRLLLQERETVDWRTGRPGVAVTVADTGCGMSDETREKAFKAFYTTKGIGGTGLGLWISDEIVQKHHGRMLVRSRSGEAGRTGTVFMMFIPYALE